MPIVTIDAAKTTLSQLLARVEAGEEIVLARCKQPVAKLVPFSPNEVTFDAYGVRGAVPKPAPHVPVG